MSAAPKAPSKPKAIDAVSMVSSDSSRRGNSPLNKVMSIQKLLDMNDIPDIAYEPGPGYYFGPDSACFSAMGEQKLAKSVSAPSVSLPHTGWDQWAGVVISKIHSNTILGKDSPTAKYPAISTLGTLAPKIGTSLRPDLSLSLGVDPHGSPGPAYNVRDIQPIEREGPVDKSFGLAKRFPTDMRNANIGPGQYARKDFALNLESGRSIGTGRQAWEKVITPGWERVGKCAAGPGVGPPLWSDIKKEGSKACPIGRAERFPASRDVTCSPGPGAYSPEHVKEALSHVKSPCTNSFGKQPKKPRFRPLLVQKLEKRALFGLV